MAELIEGTLLNDLESIRSVASLPSQEARMWTTLVLPLQRDAEAAAGLLIDQLQDRSARVREAALSALARVAPLLMEPLTADREEVLRNHVAHSLPPGDRRGLTVARLLVPHQFGRILKAQLEQAQRLEHLPRLLVDESAKWAISRLDGDLLTGVFSALDSYVAKSVAEEFDARAVLAGAAVILDEPRAARLLLAAAAEGLGRSSPSAVDAAILLFITNQLGLGAANPKNLPELRELVSPRPAIALEWLGRALERLAKAGVEVRGLRKLATEGRWAMVQRALLEDIDDLIDTAGAGTRLAAALMEQLEERRLAGAIPVAMRPWASVLAAAARLRILRARELGGTGAPAAPLLAPGADLLVVLESIEGGGRELNERFGLATRALRLAGATGEREHAARARELLRQKAEFWHGAEQEPLAQIGLYLLAASGDTRALGILKRGILEPEATAGMFNAMSLAVAIVPESLGPLVESLLAGPEGWKIARGLQLARNLPARSGWAEWLDRNWEEFARLEMDSLVQLAVRVRDPLMVKRLGAEAQPGASEVTHSALLLAAAQEAPEEEVERLRGILRDSPVLAGAGRVIDCRCDSCGRIMEYRIDRAVIDRALFQASGGSQGFLPGPELTCRRCGAVDEMVPLPGVAWSAIYSDEIEWREIDLRAADPPPRTVRAFLDDYAGADGRSTRAGRLAVLGRGDAALALIDLDPEQDQDLLGVLLLLETGHTELAAEALRKARAALDGTDSAKRREELRTALNVVAQVLAVEHSGAPSASAEEELWERRDPVKTHARPRRNDPCPCGSGRKYKQCCLRRVSR